MNLIESAHALPARRGEPAHMTSATPQEQLDQFPEDWTVIDELAEFAFALEGVIEQRTQIAPNGSRALNLSTSMPGVRTAFLVNQEFAHIHNPPTGSMHMTLPEPYRSLAIAKGWALRHPFALRNPGAADAVFVFAPRDRGELKWAKLLLQISYTYAIGKLSC